MISDLGFILVAGGRSSRFGSGNKLLQDLDGMPVFLHSVRTFLPCVEKGRFVIAVPHDECETFARLSEEFFPGSGIVFADGGAFRSASVQNALAALPMEQGFVAIHDAARPLADVELLEQTLALARLCGGAIPGKPVTNTLKAVDADGFITGNIPRSGAFSVETPQIFDLDKLRQAYSQYPDTDFTDDASVFTACNFPCMIYRNERENEKITYAADLARLLKK